MRDAVVDDEQPAGGERPQEVGPVGGVEAALGVEEDERPGGVRLIGQDLARVGDDVVFGCENLGVPREEMWHRARRALDMVGLPLPFDHPTEHLSGGQKQRLALAGVIAMGAQVIVLDEPTANLDPGGVRDVRDAVAQVAAETGATLIVVEHRVDTWCDVVDRLVVLGTAERGIIADGPPHHVLEHYGQRLADVGVWVPGMDVPIEPLPGVGDAQSALQATQLSVGWDSHTPVGEPRTLHLPLGCSTVITGPNGAGKTTLGLTLAGLLNPIAGTVEADATVARGLGTNPGGWTSEELASRIGCIFQNPEHQFLARTVREELLIGATLRDGAGGRGRGWFRKRRTPTTADLERVDELLHMLRLDHLAEAHPFSLSGGQKRRLSVATALVCAPSVIIMDEPTFGQDRRTFIELVRLLRGLREEGITLAAITHDELFIALIGQHHIEVR